jgi:glycogen operon protein
LRRFLAFRGLDNPTWYVLERGRHYRNASGCGNTLRCAHPTVRRFILDSLHYWVTEMGVDGFRFDLATILGRDSHSEFISGEGSLLWEIAHDPVLADVKLISESWDAEGMVKVGALPEPFSEWNGRFRDDVRRFVRGDPGIARDLARRIGGSRDPFRNRSTTAASLNFVTCHDGFTLRDLVSYGTKHNVRNGEGNRDGTNDNHSDNCGVEGETDDGRIRALRKQQAKNFLVTLFSARGVPMLLGGDELWRTQQGNNNPWCQDNELSWFDWTETPDSAELTRFVAGLIALRGRLRALHQTQFCDPFDAPRPDLHWHGIRLGEPDFSHGSRTLAVHFRGGLAHAPPGPDRWATADVFLVLNAWRTALDFQLPGGREWRVAVSTAEETPRDLYDLDKAPLVAGRTVRAPAYSSLMLVSAG